ncbi:hypothetical protein CFP56_001620 [Quercus suber]|uniref:Uncharacterized protein n=1 Tax=Quercus suber TaxID=58331 RepID=A0AAW0LGQ5_QUESU
MATTRWDVYLVDQTQSNTNFQHWKDILWAQIMQKKQGYGPQHSTWHHPEQHLKAYRVQNL